MTRGRGDAPLEFGEASPELKEDLKTQFLPRGQAANPQAAELYGLSAVAPRADPKSGAQGAARGQTDPDSGQVIRRRWSAGQRDAVRNYFKEK